jgi:hypothetical protein
VKLNIGLLSPAAFAVVLISFLLPWVSFSCDGHTFATITGLDLVTGTTFEKPAKEGDDGVETIPSDALAITVLFLALCGLGMTVLQKRISLLYPAATSVLAIILLLMLRANIDNDAAEQTHGLLQPEFKFGFWLAFLALLASSILNIYGLLEQRRQVLAGAPPHQATGARTP